MTNKMCLLPKLAQDRGAHGTEKVAICMLK